MSTVRRMRWASTSALFVLVATLVGVAPVGAVPLSDDEVDAEVFMNVDASFGVTVEVHRSLNEDPAVAAVEFIDKDEAYQSFSVLFASNPDLVRSVTPAMLPASFRVKLSDPAHVERWSRRVEQLAGVDQVVRPNHEGSRPPFEEIVHVCTERDYRLEAFMAVRATPTQIAAVRDALGQNPAVHDVQYLDKQAALREFARIFKNDPKLVHSVKASDLPVSFRFDVDGDGDTETRLVTQLSGMPGMDEVAAPTGVCDALADLGLVPGWQPAAPR